MALRRATVPRRAHSRGVGRPGGAEPDAQQVQAPCKTRITCARTHTQQDERNRCGKRNLYGHAIWKASLPERARGERYERLGEVKYARERQFRALRGGACVQSMRTHSAEAESARSVTREQRIDVSGSVLSVLVARFFVWTADFEALTEPSAGVSQLRRSESLPGRIRSLARYGTVLYRYGTGIAT